MNGLCVVCLLYIYYWICSSLDIKYGIGFKKMRLATTCRH